MWIEFWQVGLVLGLLAVGFTFGTIAERRHYRSILRREDELRDVVAVAAKTVPPLSPAPQTHLVQGSVVVSVDYFKRMLATLHKIFGGRVRSYESLIDRARREAMLRMQAQARRLGARLVFNVRVETSAISQGSRGGIGSVEVLAYGTAVIDREASANIAGT